MRSPFLSRPIRPLSVFLAGLFFFLGAASVSSGKALIQPELEQALETAERVPAIILLEADLPDRGQRAQLMESVSLVQARFLHSIDPAWLTQPRLFRSVPGIAGNLNRQGLDALRSRSEVSVLGVDPVGQGMLGQSVPLTRADLAQAIGFTGEGVTVAVLDSGYDTDHENLSDDLVGEACFCARGGACCPNGNATQTGAGASEDDQSHGTWVSGQITSNGSSGSVGMAPDTSIVAIKILDSTNSGLCSDAVLALEDVRDNWTQVDLVNMSLGFNPISNSPCEGGNDPCIDALAPVLQDLQDDGVAVFASSGNDGVSNQMRPPACISTVISVGAVYDANVGTNNFGNPLQCSDFSTAADQVTCYSNADSQTDLLAPGTCISSSSLGGGVGGCGQGTSASCPHAVGCAALVVERVPGISPANLLTALTSTGVSVLDSRNNLTYPRIDCLAALCQVCSPIELVQQVPDPAEIECETPGGTPADAPAVSAWASGATATSDCGSVPGVEWETEDDFLEVSCDGGMDHSVMFTATHACGDQVEDVSSLTVLDTLDPQVSAPGPVMVECTQPGGTPATDPSIAGWLAVFSATDICDPQVDLDLDAPALFPAGCAPGQETVVTATATDACGNTDQASSEISVQDSLAPEVSVMGEPSACLWPPNHEYVCLEGATAAVQVSDLCDAAPTVHVTCISDQCDDAPCADHPGQNGDGNTTEDCVYDPLTDTVCLRAERAGTNKEGRTYSIVVVAEDSCGNLSEEATALTVHVPHSQAGEGCQGGS